MIDIPEDILAHYNAVLAKRAASSSNMHTIGMYLPIPKRANTGVRPYNGSGGNFDFIGHKQSFLPFFATFIIRE